MSRWYRSPEIILCDVNYNQSLDVWAMGCVLAEMINCTETQLQKRNMSIGKRIMFKGTSCYPISPFVEDNGEVKNGEIDSDDQIIKILKNFKID
jgi:serine/threonine protein kinase